MLCASGNSQQRKIKSDIIEKNNISLDYLFYLPEDYKNDKEKKWPAILFLHGMGERGNDLDLAAGYCGSVSGSINVTVGQPHIKVDSITVGGR